MQERKSIRKLRAALDQQTFPARKQSLLPKLSSTDNERTFERLVRGIRQLSSVGEARRYRSEISRQYSHELDRHSLDTTYMKRLEVGKRLLDQRVTQLSGQEAVAADQPDLSLRDVLYDATGLSYFMEFMDRQSRLSYVQFWIVVDGLQNDADTWTESERQDLLSLSNGYLSRPELQVPPESQAIVKAFIRAGNKATTEHYRAAREVVDDVQQFVFAEMNKSLPAFSKSDLYYKYRGRRPTKRPIDLRRQAMSTTDLDRLSRPVEIRRSTDLSLNESISNSRPDSRADLRPELRRSADSSRSADDRRPIDASRTLELEDPLSGTASLEEQSQVEAAVKDALNNIIQAEDSDMEASQELPPRHEDHQRLVALGLLGTPRKQSLFPSSLFDDSAADEEAPTETDDSHDDRAELMASLALDIEKLESQIKVLDSLIEQAAASGNLPELSLLQKSRGSLDREVQRKQLQKQQFLLDTLDARSHIAIKSVRVEKEQDGREFAVYEVEIKRDDVAAAVEKRFSEFHQLYRSLSRRFKAVRDLDFPSRQTLMTLQKDFLRRRRVALEKFLQDLLKENEVSQSIEVRGFLSTSTSFATDAEDDNTNHEQPPFVQPIVDAFIELFEIETATGNAWLRGQALVLILQQLLGGAVERKVRDLLKSHLQNLDSYVDLVTMKLSAPRVVVERLSQHKQKSAREASLLLATLIEDMAGAVVGRNTAAEAGKRLARCLSVPQLNTSLLFSILDELVATFSS